MKLWEMDEGDVGRIIYHYGKTFFVGVKNVKIDQVQRAWVKCR